MPILGDFTVISHGEPDPIGRDGSIESPFVIGDSGPPTSNGRLVAPFGTGGRHHSHGLLTLMVRSLTDGSASVRINNQQIGRLSPSSNADQAVWRQQQFVIRTNILSGADSDSANTLVIGRVAEDDNVPGSFDDFFVSNIVCFFHQAG